MLVLFAILFYLPLSTQDLDTADLIGTIYSNQVDTEKFGAFHSLCEFLLQNKDYVSLEKYAMDYFQYSSDENNQVQKVEATYYLVRSAYYQRKWEMSSYYVKIGIGLAKSTGDQERLAYFYNTQGITLRRMDNCEGAIDSYLQAIEINKAIKDSLQLGRNYNNLANCYRETGKYARSLEILNEGLAIRQALKDTVGIGNLYMNLGNTFDEVYNYEKAIENYLSAQQYYTLAKNNLRSAGSLFNTGLVYHNLNNYDQAIKYYNQVKQITEDNGYDGLLGTVYQNLGNVYSQLNQSNKAIENHQAALRVFEEQEMLRDQNDVYLNLGIEYSKINKTDSAQYFLSKSLELSRSGDDNNQLANAHLELGRLFIQKGAYKNALENLEKGKLIAEKNDNKKLLSYAQLYLYELYEKIGDSSKALAYFKNFHDLKDSLALMAQEKSVTTIKARYDFEKQADEIELLNKENELKEAEVVRVQNQRTYLLILLLLSSIILGGITFLFRYSKKKNSIITQERDKAKTLLLNILPPKTAEELTQKGSVKAKRYDEATVLFTDFVHFSKYSKNIPPEEVVRNVDFYFRNFDRISEKYGMEKIKTIGDAYMCVGGLPEISSDHPMRAIMTAKEILRFVKEIQHSPPEGIHPFDIRIGINTGPVVAGVVGLNKFQYDIWGDTVNMASKMESSARHGSIAISQYTYEKVKEHIECQYRGEVEIKNYLSANTYEIII